jgi:hypothetical protein
VPRWSNVKMRRSGIAASDEKPEIFADLTEV